VRRILGRHGLDLLKPQKAYETGYMVREAASGRIVFGDKPVRFSKTLEDIEAYVEGLVAGE
jgi:hypothetical protein